MNTSDTPPTASDGAPADRFDPNRDLVVFYSRLTHTLENAGGREALARRLSEFRHGEPDAGDSKEARSAVFRAFKRLGLFQTNSASEDGIDSFAEKMGEAVSRPKPQVLLQLRLFAAGDEKPSLKPVCGATPQCHLCQLTRECDYFNSPRKPAMTLLTPAARLASGNDQALSDAELLSIILFGDKATGMEPVVSTLFARYGRLRAMFRAEAHEYAGIRDMTKSQALRLGAIAALHRRLLAELRGDTLHISSARDIHDRYAPELRDYRVEAAVLLLLDQQNNVIRDIWFCEGSTNVALVSIADLLRPAIREFATRVALVHNHPSNNPSPSLSDLEYTRRLRSACDVMGLGLVDHVIVAESGYYSFAEEGMLGG